MKPSNFFLLPWLVCLCLVARIHAQDPAPPRLYWYTVCVTRANGTEQFTGSSIYDEDMFSIKVQGTRPIKLENLRYSLSNAADAKWAPGGYVGNPAAVFIPPQHILYYVKYLAEPPLRDKASEPAP